MKKFFISLILLIVSLMVIPNVSMAGDCACTPKDSTQQATENECTLYCSPGEVQSYSNQVCSCLDFAQETDTEAACDNYCQTSGSSKLSFTDTPPEPATPPAPVTPPEQHVGLGEAETALDKFLGSSQLGGELITDSVPTVIGNIIRVFLGVVGSIALALLIYGGVIWMTAGGNPDRMKKAKGTIVWSILGLAIILGSYTIISTIISGLEHRSQTVREAREQRSTCLQDCQSQYEEDLVLECKPQAATEVAEGVDIDLGEETEQECEARLRQELQACRNECREAFQ